MGKSLVVVVLLALVVLGGAYFIYQRSMGDPGRTGHNGHDVSARATTTDAGTRVDDGAGAAVDGGVVVDNRAEIVSARGNIQTRAGDKGPWRAVAAGDRLNTDDAVRAGRNSEATLRMGNGVEVRLSPRSEFTIRELNDEVSKIRLDEGHVTASVDENGKRVLKVAAKGTDAEAESRGGEFGVVTDGNGQLAVATTTGSVKLSAGGATVDVAAGQTSAIADGRPAAPTAIPSSLFLKVAGPPSSKTNQTQVTLTGQTDPGSIVRSGDVVAKVDEKGRFKVQVPLKDGANTVAVEVVDAQGRTKTQALPAITVDRVKPTIDAETTWGPK
jgi:hypothetical protein